MAEITEIDCPNCGAAMEVSPHFDRAVCKYCGGHFIIARETVPPHQRKTMVKAPPEGMNIHVTCERCDGTGRCHKHVDKLVNAVYGPVYCKNGWCPGCGGTGIDDWLFFKTQCPTCGGWKVCPSCRGTGKCPYCRGHGLLVWEPKYRRFKTYPGA